MSSQNYQSSNSNSNCNRNGTFIDDPRRSSSRIPVPGRRPAYERMSLHRITSLRNFSVRATIPLQQNDSTAADSTKTIDDTASEPSSTDDECPSWQNPNLHTMDTTKIFLSEYDAENGDPPPMVPLPPVDIHGDGKVLADPHLHDIADEIIQLNMIEMKELVDRVAEHFGIEDDDSMGAGDGGDGAGGEEVEEKVEKSTFDVKLTGFDAKSKIKVIKEVRAITALGLKEAKALVDGAPKVVKSGIKMEEAEELKAKLEAIGATIEIV